MSAVQRVTTSTQTQLLLFMTVWAGPAFKAEGRWTRVKVREMKLKRGGIAEGWKVEFTLPQGILGNYNKPVGLSARWMFMTVAMLDCYGSKFLQSELFINVRLSVQHFQVQSKISPQ